MRAWCVVGTGEPLDVLRPAELETPRPGPGELLVEVEAAGVGLPDVLMCRGTYALTPAHPFVAGQEVVGRVVGVGDGTELPPGLAPGDRVVGVTAFPRGVGGFAEITVVPARNAWPAPPGMSAEQAAGFVIPYHTAWIGLVARGGVRAGDVVLVLGAGGGSGAAAVDLAAALGATVVAVAAGPDKAELCRRLGAVAVVDAPPAEVPALVARTAPDGVDLVYDPVGGDAGEAAVRCLRRDGRLLAVGFASGRWSAPDTARLVRGNVSHVGVYAGGYDRAEMAAFHAALCALHADGALAPAATAATGFDALPAALTAVAERRVVGKLAWRP